MSDPIPYTPVPVDHPQVFYSRGARIINKVGAVYELTPKGWVLIARPGETLKSEGGAHEPS